MHKGTERLSHLDYARICVEVDFANEIEDFVRVDLGDSNVAEIPVLVQWMPEKCQKC